VYIKARCVVRPKKEGAGPIKLVHEKMTGGKKYGGAGKGEERKGFEEAKRVGYVKEIGMIRP